MLPGSVTAIAGITLGQTLRSIGGVAVDAIEGGAEQALQSEERPLILGLMAAPKQTTKPRAASGRRRQQGGGGAGDTVATPPPSSGDEKQRAAGALRRLSISKGGSSGAGGSSDESMVGSRMQSSDSSNVAGSSDNSQVGHNAGQQRRRGSIFKRTTSADVDTERARMQALIDSELATIEFEVAPDI